MTIGAFLIPYTHVNYRGILRQIFDDTQWASLEAEGAKVEYFEVLGDNAIVFVNARNAVLNTINALPGVFQLPTRSLGTTLSDLTANQKTALRNKVQALGYTAQEIQDRFGNDIGQYTFREVLRFLLTRRRLPRYDDVLQDVVLDGDVLDLTNVRDDYIRKLEQV